MTVSPGVMLGLGKGLTRSCNYESDWLISGENTNPMIPGMELNVRFTTVPSCIVRNAPVPKTQLLDVLPCIASTI